MFTTVLVVCSALSLLILAKSFHHKGWKFFAWAGSATITGIYIIFDDNALTFILPLYALIAGLGVENGWDSTDKNKS